MPKTWKEMIMEAKREVKLVQPDEVKAKIDRGENIVIIDVREKDEWDNGHLPGAFHVPRGVLEMTVEKDLRDMGREIILHCAGGGRSALAARALKEMGYSDVASMEEGFEGWRKRGFPTQK